MRTLEKSKGVSLGAEAASDTSCPAVLNWFRDTETVPVGVA
jgi:hypothetical protein